MISPTVEFFCLEPGTLFIFNKVDGTKTYDQYHDVWVEPEGNDKRLFMTMYVPLKAYTKLTDEEIDVAIKEDLNQIFKKALNSVDGGYLTVGYYHDPKSFHHTDDIVGYLHSSQSLTISYFLSKKNSPPPWLKLKAFY